MKINEIIRERRLAKKLTQEQVANYLGITAPAVNKWEKGTSYPDIILLPALARLLDTDLNTLLSFQDNLSEKEVALFLNKVSETIDKEGFKAGYTLATAKLKEYPTCDLLINNLALLLDGSLMLNGEDNLIEKYQPEIEALYQRAAQSKDPLIREQAISCLISKSMGKDDYEQAQELLNTIPQKSPVDKKQIQANIFITQGELDKAAKLVEEKLLSTTNEILATLMTLLEIAIKENHLDNAEYISNVYKQTAQLFDLWEYNSNLALFQLYAATKDRDKCLETLIPMLKSLTQKWDINKSPLYRHIQTKEVSNTFGTKLQKSIIQLISTDKDMDFLKDSTELQKLIKEFNVEQS